MSQLSQWLEQNGWVWAERLAVVAGIIGIPAAIAGLLQLRKRARIRVGFEPLTRTRFLRRRLPAATVTLPAAYTSDPTVSDPLEIDLCVFNLGSETARDLLVNTTITWPKPIGQSHVTGVPTEELRVGSDGRPHWVFEISHINAGDHFHTICIVRVPRHLGKPIAMRYAVSMAGGHTVEGQVTVHLQSPEPSLSLAARAPHPIRSETADSSGSEPIES